MMNNDCTKNHTPNKETIKAIEDSYKDSAAYKTIQGGGINNTTSECLSTSSMLFKRMRQDAQFTIEESGINNTTSECLSKESVLFDIQQMEFLADRISVREIKRMRKGTKFTIEEICVHYPLWFERILIDAIHRLEDQNIFKIEDMKTFDLYTKVDQVPRALW